MGMVALLIPIYNDGKQKGGSCFMENQKQQLTDAAKIAQFRLSVIAPVIHGLFQTRPGMLITGGARKNP